MSEIDKTTRAALGTARMVLYGVQFETGPLDARLADTAQAIMRADEAAWNQSRASIVGNLRRAIEYPGSLKAEIGFVDRSDEEIRGFLAGVVKKVEAQMAPAAKTPGSSSINPPAGQASAF